MTETSNEPTSAARPEPDQARVASEDAPPPEPPCELEPDPPLAIHFSVGGRDWIVRVSGKGACGTGSYGLGLIEALHFCHAEAPDRPVREVLLARGRFAGLHDVELIGLLGESVAIVEPPPSRSQHEIEITRES